MSNRYSLASALASAAMICCSCDSSSTDKTGSTLEDAASMTAPEQRQPPLTEQGTSILFGRKVDQDENGGGAGSSGWQAVRATNNHRRVIRWGSVLDPTDHRKFRVRNSLRTSPTAAWTTTTHEFSASFDIEGVCPQSESIFYLVGWNTRNGVVVHVIERWSLAPKAVLMGDPPDFNVNRKMIYRGATFGDLDLIGADPEGRFLMLYARAAGELTQMFLPSEATTVLSSTMPNIESLFRIDHVTNGRMWFFQSDNLSFITTLVDQNNDMSFESITTLDYDTWYALDYISGATDFFIYQ